MLITASAIFSVLLIATGVAKVRTPHDTSIALAHVGLPNHWTIGMALGVTEIIAGLTAILTAHPFALAAQASLYVLFASWVVFALNSGAPLASCGCLGRDDTPPYWGHLVVDALGSLCSVGAAIGETAGLLGAGIAARTAQLGIVLIGAWLAWALLGDGARLAGIARR